MPFDPIYLYGGALAAVGVAAYMIYGRGGRPSFDLGSFGRSKSSSGGKPDKPTPPVRSSSSPLDTLLASGAHSPAKAPTKKLDNPGSPLESLISHGCVVCGKPIPQGEAKCRFCGQSAELGKKGSVPEAEGRIAKAEKFLRNLL